MRPAAMVRWLALVYLVYAAQHQLRVAELESGLFGGILFGIHELGHLLFAPFGEVPGAAGGSINQLLVPALAALYFAHRGDRFAAAACGCWLAVSLGNLAVYVADARAESLDLVSFSPDGGIHDWNFLLERFGVLRHDVKIAHGVRALGWVVLAASAGLAAHTLLRPRATGAAESDGRATSPDPHST